MQYPGAALRRENRCIRRVSHIMDQPRTPSFRLDGRRVLVAGASSGIGLGCAVALAEMGGYVVMAARGLERLSKAVVAVQTAGFAAEALELDISDVGAVRAALGGQPAFDVLVNAAGMARHGPALQTEPEDFATVTDVNLRGAYFLAQTVARGQIDGGISGSIITLSSQMGHVGGVERAVYCATKHGIEGFTKAMAIEWGAYGIRVNTICPTFIRTPLTQTTFDDPDRRRWIEEKIKLGRVGEVEDIMGAVVFLASDVSAMITGTALVIDGGWMAG